LELENMPERVKRPSQKRSSNQRVFIEALIQWVALKLIAFRSVNHPLFKERVQHANPDFCVPVHHTLKHHVKRLTEIYRQLPERQKKSYDPLMVDGVQKFGLGFLVVTMSWKDMFDSWT
jgi:hypothetical protein